MPPQVLSHDNVSLKQTTDDHELTPFIPQESTHRWNKRTTGVKIKVAATSSNLSNFIIHMCMYCIYVIYMQQAAAVLSEKSFFVTKRNYLMLIF